MRIKRTLPPAATPIRFQDLLGGFRALFSPTREIELFRADLAAHFGVRYCFLVSSGTAALTLILLALKDLFPRRDEVVIPAYTCYSVPSSVVRAGLKVRLCDLRHGSVDFDFNGLAEVSSGASEAEARGAQAPFNVSERDMTIASLRGDDAALGKRMLAVIPTHLYGIPTNVLKVRDAICDPSVTVIEDAAQAFGETFAGRMIGALGDVSFFSLGRGKAFSVVEGGVILTNRENIGQALQLQVKCLPGYGARGTLALAIKALAMMIFTNPRLFWLPRAIPSLRLGETVFDPTFPMLRMAAFQAGLGRNWRTRLHALREDRKSRVARWLEVLRPNRSGDLGMGDVRNLALPRLPVRIESRSARDAVLQGSVARGLGIMPAYPASINALPQFADETKGRAFPVAEQFAAQLITLPTHGYLRERDVEAVCALLSPALALNAPAAS